MAPVHDYRAFSRDRRPVLVELAAAMLIVGSLLQSGLRLTALAGGADVPPLAVGLGFGMDVLAIVTGLLIRAGYLWLVCVNVVVVLAFLDFREVVLGGSIGAALFLALDSLAVVAVVRHRWWWERDRSADQPRRRTRGPLEGWTDDGSAEALDEPADPRPGRG